MSAATRDAPAAVTAPGSAFDAADPTVAERLIAAAAEVFAEKGYEGAGVAEIARRAGLTTGAIYSRYSGKAELLIEAIDAYSTDEFDELFLQHDFSGHATDIIETAGAHLVTRDASLERPELLLEAMVTARREPEVAQRLGAHLEQRAAQLAVVIEEAKLDGSVDPTVDTASVVRFCHTVSLGWLLVEALGLDLPAAGPWTDLIGRLVASLAPPELAAHLDLTADSSHANSPTDSPTQEH
jgi:TetR/AcrR family transcriptional repressor of uid operon